MHYFEPFFVLKLLYVFVPTARSKWKEKQEVERVANKNRKKIDAICAVKTSIYSEHIQNVQCA